MAWLKNFFRHLSALVSFSALPPEQREIVFYSEGGTYWVHLRELVEGVLATDRVGVCYISSDDDDPGLTVEHSRLRTFKIDEGAIRNWLFENIDTRVMVMTMPDLHQYQVKKSRHNVHYVYTQHSLVSFHMVYRTGAFDYFDTIFCSGPHHLAEMRALEEQRQLPPKALVEHGYPRLDDILAGATGPAAADGMPHVLVAPSWGPDSITDTVAVELLGSLLAAGYRVTFRPHPQSRKFSVSAIETVLAAYESHDSFTYEGDVAGKQSLYDSHVMICDWSGAALDYAFGLEKPVLFIDVPRKVNNTEYKDIDIEPFEVGIRETIGAVMPVAELNRVDDYLEALLARNMAAEIRNARECHVFNAGASQAAGVNALLAIAGRL